jgi:hypothetical protein
MKKYILNFIFSLSLLSLISGCGGNGSSTKTKDSESEQSIIENDNTNYEIVKGSTIKINASNIVDDSKVEKYEWLIDDEVVSDKKELNVNIHQDIGIHKVCLKLTYKDGKTDMSCRDIKVINSKLGKPTVIIDNIPNSGWKTKCPITLDAKRSSVGAGGSIANYKWFKDGKEIGHAINQTYSFEKKGDHNITLQVTDNENNTNTKTEIVNIQEIGKPTVKLTILSPYQREISSNQSNSNITFPTTTQNDSNFLPYEGNSVFFSTHGSFDDCNFTDDNLTYIWDARIYKNGNDTLINHCFSQKDKKSHLAKVHKDFNTTGFAYQSFQTIIDTDPSDYSHMNPTPTRVSKEEFEKTKYIYPYSDPAVRREGVTQHEYVYIELCGGKYLDYDRLEIELTVKDNLHNTETKVFKTIEIKEATSTTLK